MPLLLVGLTELLLAFLGVGERQPFFLENERDGVAVWQANQEGPWGRAAFEPQHFAREKGSVYRIFCVGASTVKGSPFDRHCSFSKWLAARLRFLHPTQDFEVIRLAEDGRSAEDVADLCEEALDYQPDLLVVYSGHNEFLRVNLAAVVYPGRTSWWDRSQKFRLGRWLTARRWRSAPVNAGQLIAGHAGIDDSPYLTEEQMAWGVELYRRALQRVQWACDRAAVPLVLCRPASNLRDDPPARSYLSADLNSNQRREFMNLFRRGERLLEKELPEAALAKFRQCEQIDRAPARLTYEIARCLDALGEIEAARPLYLEARDRDSHPRRVLSAQLKVIDELGEASPTTHVADPVALFRAAAKDGLPGYDLFVDYVHPDLDQQNLVAEAILQAMAQANLLAPEAEWRFADEPSVAEYREAMNIHFPQVATDYAQKVLTYIMQVLAVSGTDLSMLGAEQTLRCALEYDPENPSAHLGMALLRMLENQKEAAGTHLQVAWRGDSQVVNRCLGAARKIAALRQACDELQALLPVDPAEEGN
jgi:hypothetical protein